MSEPRNIFVIGLDDFHEQLLGTVRGAENFRFHGLIPYDAIVNPSQYDIDELIRIGREQLDDFSGSVDAIIGHWDFPTTSLLPVLREHAGLSGPSLEACLRCENKYWTRCEQHAAAPELAPPFELVDPADDAVADDPPLSYPFWLKPVVAFSSTLGFRVADRDELHHALSRIRPSIGKFAKPFNRLLRRATLRGRRVLLDGGYCLAEGLIGGCGCTLEGYILNGETHVYAVIDSLRGPNKVSFVGYHYPSSLPDEITQRMISGTDRVIRRLGLEQTPFNVEYFWDEETDDIKLLEVNARISKSHTPLFSLVDGASHHEVAIDVALGRRPEFPRREGRYQQAAKFMPRVYQDTRVTRVPDDDDVARLKERFPEAEYYSSLEADTQLSELPNQDSYSFELGDLFIGGESQDELNEKFSEAMELLDVRFADDVETNW